MFVELTSIPYGSTERLDGVFADKDVLIRNLGANPVGEFKYHLECTPRDGGLYVTLSVEGKVEARCDLCGTMTVAPCSAELDELFTTDDPEYDFIKNGYNLDRFLEDCIVLSGPRAVRCKPDCKGLCLKCGVNLNFEECKCSKDPEGESSPFGILQDIILTGGAKNGSTKK